MDKYNCVIITNMDSKQLNLHKKEVTNQDIFTLKYDGPSFDNRMELHSFTKQISSVEKILKETIDTLHNNHKIKDTSKDAKYYLELRQGSFETMILIMLSTPILTNIVSDCIYDCMKFLLDKVKSRKYKKEVTTLINSKAFRKSTKEIFNPCVNNSDTVTIIHGDNINLIFQSEQREKIDTHLKEIESKLPIEEYEGELIGEIRKLDAIKAEDLDDSSKIKLGFVIEGQQDAIDVEFKDGIKEKELRNVFFTRLKIKGKLTYRGGELVKILIKSYEPSPKKKLTDF